MRKLKDGWLILLNLLVGAWSVFLLVVGLYMEVLPLLMGTISLIFGLAIVFLVYPIYPGGMDRGGILGGLVFGTKRALSVLGLALIVASVVPCIYIMAEWETIVHSPGMYETYQLVIGGGLVICMLEGTRRALGNPKLPQWTDGFVLISMGVITVLGLGGAIGFYHLLMCAALVGATVLKFWFLYIPKD